MPENRLESPNEDFAYDVCPEFSGGMASAPRANLLNQNQASLLQNVEYDTQGITRTRRGTRQFQTASAPGFLGGITVNLPDNKVITTVTGGGVQFCLSPNVTSTPPGGNTAGANHTGLTGVASTGIITDNAHGYSDGTRVQFSSITANHTGLTGVAATDIITDNAHGWANGTTVSFSAITGGAGLAAATTYYIITATANTYQLSLTFGGAAINFTTDITAGTITSVGAYAGLTTTATYFILNSTANTYQLSSVIAGPAVTFYTNVTAATIGAIGLFAPGDYVATAHGQTGAYYSDGQNPVAFCDGKTVVQKPYIPVGSLLAWHTNRLFVAGIPGRPNTLKCSGILDDTLWLANFSIDIGNNDGDKIVAILPYQDFALIVFKRNSVWIVVTDPQATNAQGQLSASAWVVQSVPGALGCVAPRTVAVVGNDAWFQAQDGVRVLQRAEFVTAQFNLVDPVTAPLRDYLRRFNRSADPLTACAVSFNGDYMISLPLDGSLTNTTTLVYRQITKSWMGVWTLQAQGFIVDNIFQPNRLLIATTDNILREYLDYYQDFQADPTCFQDLGVGIQTIIRTRAMIFGEIVSPKQGQFWETEFYQSRSANTAISASADGNTDVPLLSIDTGLATSMTLPTTVLPFTLPAIGVKKRGSNLRQLNTDFRELIMVITNTDLLPVTFRYCSAATTTQPVRYETT